MKPLDSTPGPVPAAPAAPTKQDQGEQRRLLIHSAAVSLGAEWSRNWRERVRDEGRDPTGGWPGTLPEARARVLRHLDWELAQRGKPLPTLAELAIATSVMYAQARTDWLNAIRDAKRRTRSEG